MLSKATDHTHPGFLRRWTTFLRTKSAVTWVWIKGIFGHATTEAQQRQEAKAKHREIRRDLRGLPPESPP